MIYESYKLSRHLIDAALVLGLRFEDQWLLYGGPFYFSSPYEVSQGTSGGSPSSQVSGKIENIGGNIGVQWRSNEAFSIRFETAFNTIRSYLHEEKYLHGGLVMSKSF